MGTIRKGADPLQLRGTGPSSPPDLAAEVVALRRENQRLGETVSRLRSAVRELGSFAYLDPLTGLANRRQFHMRLASEVRRSAREHESITLVICDVDRFKVCNDSFGHDTGDRLLVDIGRLLRRYCRRGGDLAARYAGDEFVLLWPRVADAAAPRFAEELRIAAHDLRIRHPAAAAAAAGVTISVGVSTFDGRGDCDCERLLRTADRALYRSKSAGRDRATFLAFDVSPSAAS